MSISANGNQDRHCTSSEISHAVLLGRSCPQGSRGVGGPFARMSSRILEQIRPPFWRDDERKCNNKNGYKQDSASQRRRPRWWSQRASKEELDRTNNDTTEHTTFCCSPPPLNQEDDLHRLSQLTSSVPENDQRQLKISNDSIDAFAEPGYWSETIAFSDAEYTREKIDRSNDQRINKSLEPFVLENDEDINDERSSDSYGLVVTDNSSKAFITYTENESAENSNLCSFSHDTDQHNSHDGLRRTMVDSMVQWENFDGRIHAMAAMNRHEGQENCSPAMVATNVTGCFKPSISTTNKAVGDDFGRCTDEIHERSMSMNSKLRDIEDYQRQNNTLWSRASMSMRNLGSTNAITSTGHRGDGPSREKLAKDMSIRSLPTTIQINAMDSTQYDKTSDEVASILQNQHNINLILSSLIMMLSVSGTNSESTGDENLQTLVENLCKEQEDIAERLDTTMQTLLEEAAIQKMENGSYRDRIASLNAYITRRTRSTSKPHGNWNIGDPINQHNPQQDVYHQLVTEINVPTATIDISRFGDEDYNRLVGSENDCTIRLVC